MPHNEAGNLPVEAYEKTHEAIYQASQTCLAWVGAFNRKRVCVSIDANTLSVLSFSRQWEETHL